ncbi:MAG: enoyl-CoA hydratase-related protein, partial [Gammaproteobacteria bacterium]
MNGGRYLAPMTTSEDAVNQGGVTTAVADGVGVLTFYHPKSNSLPARLLTKLAEEVDRLSNDASVRVITMQSEGNGAFCAGASFDELTRVETPEGGQQFFSGFGRVILAMIR